MKHKSIVLSFFLSIFIISCNENSPKSLKTFFSKAPHYQITPHILNIDSLFIGNVWDIVGFDNYLILLDEYDNKYFSLIDIESKKVVKRFGNKGRGPHEMIFPVYLSIDKENREFLMLLRNPPRMIQYSIDSLINKTQNNYTEITRFDFNNEAILQATMLFKKRKFVTTGMFHHGRYGIANYNGKLDTIIGDMVVADKHKNISNYNLGQVYQGITKSYHSGNKFVYASLDCDLIEIVNTDNYSTKRFYSFFPKIKGSNGHFGFSRDSRNGYMSLKVTERFIYVIYSGRTYGKYGNKAFGGNKLYVFDWNLNPVCSYSLKHDINCMYVTDDDKTMYSVITLDEPVLVKYDLKHVK